MDSIYCACGSFRRGGQRNCTVCHAKNMREWRKTHPLNDEQRKKDNCRSMSHSYLKRGKIQREPCWCGTKAEMHHEDYNKPKEVIWMCRPHHLEHHRQERAA